MNVGRGIKIAISLLFIGLIVGFFIWTNNVMPANQKYAAIVTTSQNFRVKETNHSIILSLQGYTPQKGLVFIPGAKVDPHAYLYKLSGVVESTGMTIVIVKPYFNLALLDLRPIATFTNDVDDINKWYVGGHSLGGVRACQYAADSSTHVSGLILFGSYCNSDVSLPTLSLSGEHDKLTSQQDIKNNAKHLTGDVTYHEIANASHASFGDYGTQAGDGEAAIDSEFMRLEITEQISNWLAAQ